MKKILKNIAQKRKYEFIGIASVILALLNTISLLSKDTGFIGELFFRSMRLIAGEGVYGVPFLLVIFGVGMIYKSKFKVIMNSRVVGLMILLTVILITLHLPIEHPNEFSSAFSGEGGGMIGGLFLYILRKFFAKEGTYIVISGLALMGILLLFDIFLVNLIVGVKDSFSRFLRKIFKREKKAKKKSKKKSKKKVKVVKKSSSKGLGLSKIFSKKDKEEPKKNKKPPSKPNRRVVKEVESSMEEVASSKEANYSSDHQKKRINKKIENKDTYQDPLDFGKYSLPPLDLLNRVEDDGLSYIDKTDILRETLKSFGVKAEITDVNYGPTITRYEIQPAPGVKVSKILNLADDIALSLAASDVRIEAPIPGKAAVGIEVPNDSQSVVTAYDILNFRDFQDASSKLTIALGKDIGGKTVIADLGKMPHMLVAGATGSGKSVFVNTLINSILYKATPEEVKFLLIDPKMVELTIYKKIPHLVAPVVTDAKKAATALRWVVQEMDNRYELFAGSGARGIDSYNKILESDGSDALPYIVVIIDELADLMMVAAKEVEDAICRLAQKARAAGIHLVLATQRPSVDVITGLIKANIPTRVSFSLSSQTDSRTILDKGGAEKLLGKGDMLFSPVGSNQLKRIQGAFISDEELKRVVKFVRGQMKPEYSQKIANIKEENIEIELDDEKDELYERAVGLVVEGKASISMLQRRLRIGYNRAARMIDKMEEDNIVGEHRGSKPREVLIEEENLSDIFGEKPKDKEEGS